MITKRTKSLFLLVLILLPLVLTVPVSAVSVTSIKKLPFRFDGRPSWAGGGKKNEAKVDIRNTPSGETVFGDVLIIAEVGGKGVAQVVLEVGSNSYTMRQVDSTDRYQTIWNSEGLSGPQTLTVKALDNKNKELASDTVEVTVVTEPQWEITIEIDYINGHEPSAAVLDYLQGYWLSHAIEVDYKIDDSVSDPTLSDGYISNDDFWYLEREYNDDIDEDGVSDNSKDGKDFFLDEKWMLYGTWDEDSNVGGYTYVVVDRKDGLAGNYMFIADEMIDQWEGINGIPDDGGEVVVTCHEFGHSMGILVLRGPFEKYDPDAYSVMSYIRDNNAKDMSGHWYYSKEYWNTKNMDFY